MIHEHGVSARFEDAVRLAQQLVRLRVNVERMDTDDLIERLVAERVSARELAVSEGEVRQMASPPLFFRRLDERGVGIEPGDGEAGLGQRTGEVPGPAGHLEHAHVAALDPFGDRGLDQITHLRLESLVVAEARVDVVIGHAVADREHAIEPSPHRIGRRLHDASRRLRRQGRGRTRLHPAIS